MKEDTILIGNREELMQLKVAPRRNYRLTADIDLGGTTWEPIDFGGSLDGNGNCISNFHISGAPLLGFFGSLDDSAVISNLVLKEFSVTTDEATKVAGGIAAINRGRIDSCTLGVDAPYVPTPRGNRNALTGVCDDSSIYAQNTDAIVGAVVGENFGEITGAVSYVRLLGKPQGLCGKNAGKAEGLYRDVRNRTDLLPESAIAMRKQIVSHMETQGNFTWIPSKDMVFTSAYSGTVKVYEKGKLHYGLPYTQKNGSVERAAYCIGQDDYVASWLPGYSDAAKESYGSDVAPWDVYLGNDCSGAVYWSWQRVCPSVEFGFTGDMVPTEENQKLYGVLPLGSYRCKSLLTDEVIKANTPEKIIACYPLLRLGDAIVSRDPTYGHTRLVARDPMVMRHEDGSIDIDASYVPTHEHGVGKGSSGRLSTWQMDCRYTFRDLLDTHYVPITNRDLVGGFAKPVELTVVNLESPFQGSVCCNYRIISSTVELVDIHSGEVHKSVEFTALDKDRYKATPRQDGYARSTVREVDLREHSSAFASLKTGSYRFSVSVLLSTGTQHIVASGQCRL